MFIPKQILTIALAINLTIFGLIGASIYRLMLSVSVYQALITKLTAEIELQKTERLHLEQTLQSIQADTTNNNIPRALERSAPVQTRL